MSRLNPTLFFLRWLWLTYVTQLREDPLRKLVAGLDDAAESDEAVACARRGTFAISSWVQVTDCATVTANTDGTQDL